MYELTTRVTMKGLNLNPKHLGVHIGFSYSFVQGGQIKYKKIHLILTTVNQGGSGHMGESGHRDIR